MSKRFMPLSVFFALLVAATVLLSGTVQAQEDKDSGASEQQVRQLYRDGLEHLRNNKVKEAYTKFQKAIETANKLDAEIRGELLRWLWHSSTTHMFDTMLQDPELKHPAERIMELAKGAYWTWRMDQKRIKNLVQNLSGDDYQKQLESQRKLISTGAYGAPLLIDELKADTAQRRAMAIITLTDMGTTVVLPVIEALESDDSIQRQNAAVVLGEIGDPRAVPALKATLENDKDEAVRAEAREAIKKILHGRSEYRFSDMSEQNMERKASSMRQVKQDQKKAEQKEEMKEENNNENNGGNNGSDSGNTDEDNSGLTQEEQEENQENNGQEENQEDENGADEGNQEDEMKEDDSESDDEEKDSMDEEKEEKPQKEKMPRPVKKSAANGDRWSNLYSSPAAAGNVNNARTVEGLNSAVELYYDLAEKYYLSKPEVMSRLYGDSLVWSWDSKAQRVVAREVPEFMLNEELAAQACFNLLELTTEYNPVWPLLVNIYFNLYNESDIVLTQSKKMVKGMKDNYKLIEEKAFKKMQKDLREREQTFIPGQLVSVNVLYAALDRSLTDNKPLVSISCMKVLETLADPADLPGAGGNEAAIGAPLISAMMSNDRRVNTHAASLLIDIDPQKKFLAWEKVVPTLADAVRTTGLRLTLLAEPNQKRLNQIKKVLEDPNLHSQLNIARNASETLEHAKQFPQEDLLIIDGGTLGHVMYSFSVPGRSEDHQQRVIDAIKRDLRTRTTPLIALADTEQEMKDLRETYKERVDAYIMTPVNRQDLETAFEEIKEKSYSNQARDRAEGVALLAAKALSQINPEGTVFTNFDTAVPALAGTLPNRPDALRIQASAALGRFADTRAIPDLTKALDKGENNVPVRVAAGKALAKIFEKTGKKPSDEILNVIARNVVQGPIQVQMAASEAFGASNISRERRRKLLERKRPTQLGEERGDLK